MTRGASGPSWRYLERSSGVRHAWPNTVELAASSLIILRWLMLNDAGTSNVPPGPRATGASVTAIDRREEGRGPSVTGAGARASAPALEVHLTVAGPRPAGMARLAAAWTLFGVLGAISALGCISFNARDGRPIGTVLVTLTYALAVAALLWAAVETRRSDRGSSRR